MATSPIDFSKYASQPQIDFSGYAGPSQPTPAPQGAIERFARSFNKAITGSETPSDLMDSLSSQAKQIASDPQFSADPSPVLKAIHDQMGQVFDRAAQEWKQGNWSTARGLVAKGNAAIHAVESGIPIIGPMLSQADQQLGKGNVAGAAGTVTAAALPLAAPTGEGVGTVTNAPKTAPLAGLAKTASDIVDPNIIGIISPRIANVQRALGRYAEASKPPIVEAPPPVLTPEEIQANISNGIADNPNLARVVRANDRPGVHQRLNNPVLQPGSPIHGESGLPANSQVIPPPAEVPATATEVPPAPWKAAANTNDPAVIKQAQQSLVDAIIPPSGPTANLNKWTQMNVNFYVQKGDVEAAKQTIQKAVTRRDDLLEDKSFQEMGRENVQADESNYWKQKNALRQAAESPATGKTEMSVEQAAQEAARQAYEQTVQAKMPAFFREGQPKNLAVEIPSDEDLTSILQKSVEAVKKGKGIQTKP